MIEQVRALLQERNLTRAVIIDDAYDERPRVGDVETARWDRFFDDLTDDEEARVAGAYGAEDYARQTVSELIREQVFIDNLWGQRAVVDAAHALFEEFESAQDRKRTELLPLKTLLENDLGMTCQTFGRDDAPATVEADVIFLDLFLGFQEIDDAVTRAIDRVRSVVDQRRQTPPTVVLLSASPRLEETGPRLRDQARLLGCQFRMLRKADLAETEKVLERLYELARSRPDSLKLNAFLLAWETAIEDGKAAFLQSIRRLDLPDYANLDELVLKAEDEPLGDYVLDLYDLHFHNVLEGNEALVRAARTLNEISWTDYPPPQFMPTPEVVEMMDGALFENEARTRVEVELPQQSPRFGDVFLAPLPPPPPADPGAGPAAPIPRYAYVVLSQACDLQHGDADQILLLRGTVKPYSAGHHGHQRERTPIMRDGESRFAVEWDVLAPETWHVDTVATKLADGYRRIRRFRSPSALQLQQAFLGNLGRVGTLTAAPARYPAGVKAFLRTQAGTARLLAEVAADSGDAVYLVGRTKRNAPKEWLVLSERLQGLIRHGLMTAPADELPTAGGPVRLSTVVDDLSFYRRLKAGLEIKRGVEKGTKPFNGTSHDVLQILTHPQFEPGTAASTSFHPLILQVDLS